MAIFHKIFSFLPISFQDEIEEADAEESDSSAGGERSARGGSKSRMSAVSSLFTDVTDEEARRTRMTMKKSQESTTSKPSLDQLAIQVSEVMGKADEPPKTMETNRGIEQYNKWPGH